MKVTLNLDQLLTDEKITRTEYERLGTLAEKSTGSLAFNIQIGFGVIAVSGAAFAMVSASTTAIVIGLCVLVSGLLILRSGSEQWNVLANICTMDRRTACAGVCGSTAK
jgi:iron complex transport system permease protein